MVFLETLLKSTQQIFSIITKNRGWNKRKKTLVRTNVGYNSTGNKTRCKHSGRYRVYSSTAHRLSIQLSLLYRDSNENSFLFYSWCGMQERTASPSTVVTKSFFPTRTGPCRRFVFGNSVIATTKQWPELDEWKGPQPVENAATFWRFSNCSRTDVSSAIGHQLLYAPRIRVLPLALLCPSRKLHVYEQ